MCIMLIIDIIPIIEIMVIMHIMWKNLIILIMCIIHYANDSSLRFVLPWDVWQDKRTAIAQTVDGLGDQFRPAMRAGWLAYIKHAYPDGVAFVSQSVGQGTLVVNDEDWSQSVHLHIQPLPMGPFCNEK